MQIKAASLVIGSAELNFPGAGKGWLCSDTISSSVSTTHAAGRPLPSPPPIQNIQKKNICRQLLTFPSLPMELRRHSWSVTYGREGGRQREGGREGGRRERGKRQAAS